MDRITEEEWNSAPRYSDDIPDEDVAEFFAEVDRMGAETETPGEAYGVACR